MEKKPTARSQTILHVDALYNIKRKNTKRFVQNWHSPKSPSQNGHAFFYRTCNDFFICYAVGLFQYSKIV